MANNIHHFNVKLTDGDYVVYQSGGAKLAKGATDWIYEQDGGLYVPQGCLSQDGRNLYDSLRVTADGHLEVVDAGEGESIWLEEGAEVKWNYAPAK